MTRVRPIPRRLNALDLTVRLGGKTAKSTVLSGRSAGHSKQIDDDVVSLRGQALRAPVASIVGFAELIASDDLTEDQRQLYTASMLREGRRLNALVDNALAVQRLEQGHRELDFGPVDVGALIQRAVVAAGQEAKSPISVRLPDELPLVSADAEAILEVFANFLSNARTFSPNGGAISIEARPAADMVEISIRDHGVGLESDQLPMVFQKFYRGDGGARRQGPGAGLGLAINHMIIEAHGGEVSATSKGSGKGTMFQFTLPIASRAKGSGYILIVEDDAGFASLLRAEFATFGLSAVRASDAETAKHVLAETTPRAIVLDLRLPGLQGEDFLDDVRADFGPRLPVVVMTAKDLTPEEISALEIAGAMAVLPKEAGALQAAVALIAEAVSIEPVTG